MDNPDWLGVGREWQWCGRESGKGMVEIVIWQDLGHTTDFSLRRRGIFPLVFCCCGINFAINFAPLSFRLSYRVPKSIILNLIDVLMMLLIK